MQIFDDFSFESNDLKSHAYNILKISKWYFTPIQDGQDVQNYNLTINTCLKILSVAHGFSNYKTLKSKIEKHEIFEPLQSNDTYFNRLINANTCELLDLGFIEVELAYSQIDHFFDMCASYICEVQMDLNTLANESPLVGIFLHADVSRLKYIGISNRSFIKTAILNHIVVSSGTLKFPKNIDLPILYSPYFEGLNFNLKCLNTFKRLSINISDDSKFQKTSDTHCRITFTDNVVFSMNELLYSDGVKIDNIIHPFNFKINFPNPIANTESIKCLDIFSYVNEAGTGVWEIPLDDDPEIELLHNRIFENEVLNADFTTLCYFAIDPTLVSAELADINRLKDLDCTREYLSFSERCNLNMEFQKPIILNNRQVELDIRINFKVKIAYSTVANDQVVKFSVDDIQAYDFENANCDVYIHAENYNHSVKSIHFKKSCYPNQFFPLRDFFIKYLNQKLNRSKYEVFALHNGLRDILFERAERESELQ